MLLKGSKFQNYLFSVDGGALFLPIKATSSLNAFKAIYKRFSINPSFMSRNILIYFGWYDCLHNSNNLIYSGSVSDLKNKFF